MISDFGLRILDLRLKTARIIAAVILAGMTLWFFAGCAEPTSEPERKTHPSGWIEKGSANFHGDYLKQRGMTDGLSNCRACHGADSSAVATGVSCYGCHKDYPHPGGWGAIQINPYNHQTAIQRADWDLSSCTPCHGANFRTPVVRSSGAVISCYTCHNNGPDACNVCHGSDVNAAPPRDLLGAQDPAMKSVGAHQAHLTGRSLSDGFACSECHAVPAGYLDPGHFDSTRGSIELTWGNLATDSGRAAPRYDPAAGSCSSVYCHGSFDGGNTARVVGWVGGADEASCGSCHAMPPPAPHPASETCWRCHSYSAVNHVNGVVDFR